VHDSTFTGLRLNPLGPNAITIKGASSGILVHFYLESNGTRCDVELGQFDNYWYPGRPPTSDILLENRGPLRALVLLWDATEPVTVGPHQLRRIPKFVWFPYFLFRYMQLRLENVYRRLRKLPLIKTS
jgi:hypothetical protein